MINNRHIVITGFLQNIATPNGMDKVYMNLLNFQDRNTTVDMKVWNSHWKEYARFIERTGPSHYDKHDIRCYCYSWGCGYGFVRLAKELRKLGIKIKYAVFSDPVYYPGILKYRALFNLIKEPVITIPDNVENVYYYRQNTNRPKGSVCVAEDTVKTKIYDLGILPGVIHQSMDDSPYFRDQCLKVAQHSRSNHDRTNNHHPKN